MGGDAPQANVARKLTKSQKKKVLEEKRAEVAREKKTEKKFLQRQRKKAEREEARGGREDSGDEIDLESAFALATKKPSEKSLQSDLSKTRLRSNYIIMHPDQPVLSTAAKADALSSLAYTQQLHQQPQQEKNKQPQTGVATAIASKSLQAPPVDRAVDGIHTELHTSPHAGKQKASTQKTIHTAVAGDNTAAADVRQTHNPASSQKNPFREDMTCQLLAMGFSVSAYLFCVCEFASGCPLRFCL